MGLKYFALIIFAIVLTACDVDSNITQETAQPAPSVGSAVVAYPASIKLVGDAQIGSQLTANVFDKNGFDRLRVIYQWYADDIEITGETRPSFTPTDAQLGLVITASAAFEDNNGFNERVMSAGTEPAWRANSEGLVTISGAPKVGTKLAANVFDADGSSSEIIYQWHANGVGIPGEMRSVITLTDAQFGSVITVSARYKDSYGIEEWPTSSGTTPVSRENSEGVVAIEGVPSIGNTLDADVFDADGHASEITYQWYANNIEITGETQSSLVLTDAQLGAVITVSAAYEDGNGVKEWVVSVGTVPVWRNNNVGAVTISGMPVVGNTLIADVFDADGTSSEVIYQWYANDIELVNETYYSLLLTDAQLGTVITVSAAFEDNYGMKEFAISPGTEPVWRVNNRSVVTINGVPMVGNTLAADVFDADGNFGPIAYHWYADNVEILGETQSLLLLTDAQLDAVITVTAEFEDTYGVKEWAISAETAPVWRKNNKGIVTIEGVPMVGNTLTAKVIDSDGNTSAIAYQWLANGQTIFGAIQNKLTVDSSLIGQKLSVQVDYTDDRGFTESNTSAQTVQVSKKPTDQLGSITIIGSVPYLSKNELKAEITDNNGFQEGNVIYAWFADGIEIANSNSKTFTPHSYAGSIISVSARYVDNDGFSNSLTNKLNTVIYTLVVDRASLLVSAISNGLADGDVVGLKTGTYINMDALSLTRAITIRAVEGHTPILSGELCIHIAGSANGAKLTGLTFKDIDTKAGSLCETQEDASILSEGDNFIFSQNTMNGEENKLNNPTYHWIALKGKGALIERNTFSKRNFAKSGSVIKMSTSGSDYVVQYNLFTNSINRNFSKSNLHLIKVGSSRGASAAIDTNFTIQYNRIENFVTGRRLIRVQASGATIKGNTIFNPNGGISLEDGGFNTITDNIIIRTTDIANSKDRPSGILITPLGHTVSNNYIAGIRSKTKEAGGIVFTANPFSQGKGGKPNSGNQAVLNGSGDFTLTVTNNTILNSQQPIVFSTEVGSRAKANDCHNLTAKNNGTLYSLTKNAFVINFDGNLIANGFNDDATTQGFFYPNRLSSDHAFEYDCDLINHTNSIFSNNFGYIDQRVSGSARLDWVRIRGLNGNGAFDLDGAIDQNPGAAGKEELEFIKATNTLIETNPSGLQSLAGAKNLHYIQVSEVGVGSTWQ